MQNVLKAENTEKRIIHLCAMKDSCDLWIKLVDVIHPNDDQKKTKAMLCWQKVSSFDLKLIIVIC